MKRDDDDVIELEGELPQFQDGEYDAIVLQVKKVHVFGGRWAARFRFQIVSEGSAFHQEVDAYVGLGATGRTVSPHGKLASWMRVVSAFTGGRADRVTLRAFRDFWFRVRTETVTMNARQQPLSVRDRYSVVRDVIAVVGKVSEVPAASRRPHDAAHS